MSSKRSKRREYARKWYEEHKDRFKEYRQKFDAQYVAEHGESYGAARYRDRKSKGLCTACGTPLEPDRAGKTKCKYCTAKYNLARRKKYRDLTNPDK